jgi:DNA-binding NarL/FixJ family response regulator
MPDVQAQRRLGVRAYLLKERVQDLEQLMSAIQAVAGGRRSTCKQASTAHASPYQRV